MPGILRAAVRTFLPLRLRYAIEQRRGRIQWFRLGEHVTFREAGFVAATSPRLLLARHNHEVSVIRDTLAEWKPGNALELGCGFGRLSPILADFASHLTAVDINPEALDQARQCYPSLEFKEASVTALPFADRSFDLIVSWTVLQHVPPDQFALATREIARVLAPGGSLLICERMADRDEPEQLGKHTWYRSIDDYQVAFAPLRVVRSSRLIDLERLAALPGSSGAIIPGHLMLFEDEQLHAIT